MGELVTRRRRKLAGIHFGNEKPDERLRRRDKLLSQHALNLARIFELACRGQDTTEVKRRFAKLLQLLSVLLTDIEQVELEEGLRVHPIWRVKIGIEPVHDAIRQDAKTRFSYAEIAIQLRS